MVSRQHSAPPQIDGYEYLELLGGGGFADVFLYQQARPRRKVAVKVVLHEMLSDDARRQFDAEANAMAELSSHPSIVTIYQAGIAQDGRPYLAMEYCPNGNLGERYRSTRRSAAEVLALGVQIAGAVESAHRAGILHRDIKPANILLTEYNRPALTDFGISITQGEQELEGLGMSVPWSPPETFAEPAWSGPQSDVYALAATLYSLLARRTPFELPGQANDYSSLIERICGGGLPPVGREDIPRSFEQVLATAMAKAPASRYSSALEFGRALQEIQMEMTLPVTSIDVLGDSARIAGRDAGFVSRAPGATERTASYLARAAQDVPVVGDDAGLEDYEATVLRRPQAAPLATPPAMGSGPAPDGEVPALSPTPPPPPVVPAPGAPPGAGAPPRRRSRLLVRAAAAAVAVLMVGVGAWWFLIERPAGQGAAGQASGTAGISPSASPAGTTTPTPEPTRPAKTQEPPLAVGTCIAGYQQGQQLAQLSGVPCSGAHNAEVIATPELTITQYDTSAAASDAKQLCGDAASGLPLGAGAYEPTMVPFAPAQSEWEAGQISGTCLWVSGRGDVTGSLSAGDMELPPIPYLPGDCLSDMPTSLATRTNVVDCGTAHLYELVGYPTIVGVAEEWDQDAVAKATDSACWEAIVATPQGREKYSELAAGPLGPTEATWSDGDREVYCFVAPLSDDKDVKLTGSLVAGTLQ